MRDFQKQKVYDWEDCHVAKHDKSHVQYDDVQRIVDYIWNAEGLKHPPKVVPLAKQNTRCAAKANRLSISCPEKGLPTWIIIHEIAHSMTAEADDGTNMHCEDFVGMYMLLVSKHLKIRLSDLIYSARQAGVKYNIAVKPYPAS